MLPPVRLSPPQHELCNHGRGLARAAGLLMEQKQRQPSQTAADCPLTIWKQVKGIGSHRAARSNSATGRRVRLAAIFQAPAFEVAAGAEANRPSRTSC